MLASSIYACLSLFFFFFFLYLAHVNTGTVFACIIIIIIKRMCVHILTSVKKSNRIK